MANTHKFGIHPDKLKQLSTEDLQSLERDTKMAVTRLIDYNRNDDAKDDFDFNFVSFEQDGDVRNSIFDIRTLGRNAKEKLDEFMSCLLYTSPSPRDRTRSRMPSSA